MSEVDALKLTHHRVDEFLKTVLWNVWNLYCIHAYV